MLYTPVSYRTQLSDYEWDCFIPSAVSLPTGIGDNTLIVNISNIRKQMEFPTQYRTGVATLSRNQARFVVGPPPEYIQECISDLYWYMSLAGDRMVKGWYATCFLLSVHPWEEGNGRTAREFYRRYTNADESRDSLRARLREMLPKLQPPRKSHLTAPLK